MATERARPIPVIMEKKRVLYSRTETLKAPGIIWSKPLIK